MWTTPSASPATPAPLLCTPGHRPPWEAARAGSSGWEREAGGTQETPPVLAFAFQTLPHLGAHGRGCCWRSRVRRRDSGPQKARGSCPRRAPAGETLLGGAGSRVSTPEQPREGWPPPNPEPQPSQPRPPPPGARCGGTQALSQVCLHLACFAAVARRGGDAPGEVRSLHGRECARLPAARLPASLHPASSIARRAGLPASPLLPLPPSSPRSLQGALRLLPGSRSQGPLSRH